MGRVRDADPLAFTVDGIFGSGNVGIGTPFEPDDITSYGRSAQPVIRGTTRGHTFHRALVHSAPRDDIASHLHSISYGSCREFSWSETYSITRQIGDGIRADCTADTRRIGPSIDVEMRDPTMGGCPAGESGENEKVSHCFGFVLYLRYVPVWNMT
jgi:hypothetical protein